jgi:hypothetical protein
VSPRGVLPLALALSTLPLGAGAQSLTNSDWVVLEPSVGVSYANILAFDNSGLIPGVNNSTSFGPMYGITAGSRFSIVTVAARLDFSRYDAYDVGTLGARVQVHIPLPVVKPFARIGGGWAWLGSLNPASALWTCSPGSTGNDCPSISGWNLNAGAGVDFAVQRWLTLGAGLDFYLLNLNRAASPTQVNFMRTGDSMGFQLALSAQAAFRF